MKNPFRKFIEGNKPQELTEPVSISYGKAVQLSAEGAAREQGINQPKKTHYQEADREVGSLTESYRESMAFFQKLKELVGIEQATGFLDVIESTTDRAREFVRQTAEEELAERLSAILGNVRKDNPALNREIVVNSLKDSVKLYELEVSTQVEQYFDELKSKISYQGDFPNKQLIEETVNEIMGHFAKLAVQNAVAAYRNNLKKLIVKELGEIGRQVLLEDLGDF
jgi:hypothetical protein